MSEMLQYFKSQRDQELAAAKAIADKADEEGRGMTPEESAQANDHLKSAGEYLEKQGAERDKAEVRRAVEVMGGAITPDIGQDNPVGAPPKSIGEAFIRSGVYKALQAKKLSGELPNVYTSDKVQVSDVAWRGAKANAMPVLESGMAGSGDVFAATSGQVGALTTLLGLETPGFTFVRPVIADLLQSVPVSTGNSVTYPTVAGRSVLASGSGSGFTTEGATKNPIQYDFTVATKVLEKISGYTKISEELLEDAPGLAAYINADLPFQVRIAEDRYLAGTLYGAVSQTATGSNIGGTNDYDSILDAITQVQDKGFSADGMIIAPLDWATLLATKLSGTSTGYVGGGPFAPTGNPWGLRIVVSQAATAGTAIVGDFGMGAKVYRRGGLAVDSTRFDQDDFIRNLVTIRAEERLVLGVTYPEAFVETSVTGS